MYFYTLELIVWLGVAWTLRCQGKFVYVCFTVISFCHFFTTNNCDQTFHSFTLHQFLPYKRIQTVLPLQAESTMFNRYHLNGHTLRILPTDAKFIETHHAAQSPQSLTLRKKRGLFVYYNTFGKSLYNLARKI